MAWHEHDILTESAFEQGALFHGAFRFWLNDLKFIGNFPRG